MLKENYNDYTLTTCSKRRFDDRYSVEVIIEKNVKGLIKKEIFLDTKISLILRNRQFQSILVTVNFRASW